MKKILISLILISLVSCGKSEDISKNVTKTSTGTENQTGNNINTGSEQVGSGIINQNAGFKQISGSIYGNDEISIDLIENIKVIKNNEGKQIIIFGPLGSDLGPKATNNKYQIYEFKTENKLVESDLIKKIKNENGNLLISGPEKININNLDIIKWTSGGMCNERDIEVIGNVYNYKLSSLGCSTNEKTDFNYFKKVVESIKYINKDKTDNNFSDSQIKDILAKIDENTKRQEEIEKNSTGVLVKGKFKAEYIAPKDYSKDTDKIFVTINLKVYNLPGIYTEKDIPEIKKCTGLQSNIKLENIKSNGECPFLSFAGFKGFSPSGFYLTYLAGGFEGGEFRMIDVNTGKVVLKTFSDISVQSWTLDKKQFIYGTTSGISKGEGLVITKKGSFPEKVVIEDKNDVVGIYVDDKFIYSLETNYGPKNVLKIYDLNSLKEVFSKEVN